VRLLQRGEQARELLDAEGLTVTDRYGQVKPHPAAGIEQACRLAVARPALGSLGKCPYTARSDSNR
jgi:hypothetical protein